GQRGPASEVGYRLAAAGRLHRTTSQPDEEPEAAHGPAQPVRSYGARGRVGSPPRVRVHFQGPAGPSSEQYSVAEGAPTGWHRGFPVARPAPHLGDVDEVEAGRPADAGETRGVAITGDGQ